MVSVYKNRLIINRGEDKQSIFKLRLPNGDPFDLTGATGVEVIMAKANRTDLILTLEVIPATRATGDYLEFTFSADVAGSIGNSITLDFDNVHTIDEIVTDWNDENPTNTVSHNGVGSSILASGSLTLSDGMNSYSPVEILDAKLGFLKLALSNRETNSLRLGSDQSAIINIDFGSHPSGTRKIARLSQRLDIVRPSSI